MVSPITDIGPGILRLDHLPVNPILGDPVMVVAVCYGGIQEFVDHAVYILGIGMGQGFPVLEDIPPVSLII